MVAHSKFQHLPVLNVDGYSVIEQIARKQNAATCFKCERKDSPHDAEFEKSMTNVPPQFRHSLLSCGKRNCTTKFHFSCLLKAAVLPQWFPQYHLLDFKNVLLCPDHFCTICFSEYFQHTAAEGKLLKMESHYRAFHDKCLPITTSNPGSEERKREERGDQQAKLELPVRKEYFGSHFPICVGCAREKKQQLTRCRTCCHSFHQKCHRTKMENSEGEKTHCEDCLYDAQIRRTDKVFVQRRGDFWTAAEIMDFKTGEQKETEVQVKLLSSGELSWIPRFSLCHIYPNLAAGLYDTLKKFYHRRPDCVVYDSEEGQREMRAISSMLKSLHDFRPSVIRPPPTKKSFKKEYQFHETFHDTFLKGKEMEQNPITEETYEFLKVKPAGVKGYGVFATRTIPKNTLVGEYIGNLIREEEHVRRRTLREDSCNSERKYYTYETTIEDKNENKKETIYIDSANFQNEMSLINHSCRPNCVAKKVPYQICDGVTLHKIIIKTTKAIREGKELFLNYEWENFVCLCGFPECESNNIEELDWSVEVAIDKENATSQSSKQ